MQASMEQPEQREAPDSATNINHQVCLEAEEQLACKMHDAGMHNAALHGLACSSLFQHLHTPDQVINSGALACLCNWSFATESHVMTM